MRTVCLALSLFLVLILTGCAYYPDFENTPIYHVPVAEVVNQIRCEMYDFLSSPEAKTPNPNFSLDPRTYATVKLTLSTTALGDVKFAKIDTKRLGLANILAIGSSAQPFPQLEVKNTNQTVAEIVVNISQDPKDLSGACGYGKRDVFSNAPHADRVLVNDFRISSWLRHTFASAQRIQAQGDYCDVRVGKSVTADNCSVSLETATLTSKFELIADANAGILKFENLIPVIATPVLDLNVDYYHQIQIIFNGNNSVGPNEPSTSIRRSVRHHYYSGHLPQTREPAPIAEQPITTSESEAAILKQLRSIRDATIFAQPH